jgi:ankyrin repeat protein
MLLVKQADCEVKDNDGDTSLHRAAQRGDDELVQKLLDKSVMPLR